VFRNGITVTPEVGLARNSFSTLPGSATSNAGSVALTVGVPLMRDRGGESTVAAERAAGHDYEATRLALRHTRAASVLSSVVSYWDYLAAQQRLEVLRSSEERAQRIADQTRVLVQAEERTATDLTQTLGNLAAKRVTRIAAEQGLVEARQQLGLAVGWPAERFPALPPPGTAFPEPSPSASAASAADLLSDVFARRPDLAAAEEGVASAQTQVHAAHSELRPRLDLVVTGGYRSSEPGLGFNDFFSPLYRRGPRRTRPSSSATRCPFPTPTRGACSCRPPRSPSSAASRATTSGGTSHPEWWSHRRRWPGGGPECGIAEAVRLLEATVQAEQRKFQLGVATLFDVIQAEDALTSARLGQIQSRRNHAAAIAALRFQTGTLITGEGEPATVDLTALQSP
jgi:outer membrane protein TolC